MRAQAIGTSIMARAWPTNQAEPSTWMLTVSDGDLASGFDGLRLIEQHGVGVVAGTAFGDRGEGHVRITYAAPDEVLEEGLARIGEAVEQR